MSRHLSARLLRRSLAALPVLCSMLAACGRGAPPTAGADSGSPARGPDADSLARIAYVDSLLAVFRAGLPRPTALEGGERSPEAAARAIVDALVAGDTAALRRLVLSRAEFAYLYFPTARIARPPYGIDPALLWLQVTGNGERDLRRALATLSGGARFVALSCAAAPVREGENLIHERCLVTVQRGASTDTLSLFGTMVERDGRTKVLSYANRLP